MELEEKFKNYSAKECRNLLYPLLSLNPELTLAQLKRVLEFRILEAEGSAYEQGIRMVKAVEGKCLEIYFAPGRKVWLKIDQVEPLEGYDDIDALLIGERIVANGIIFQQLPLTRETDERYSTFFPSDYKEISPESFAKIKKLIQHNSN